MNTQLLNTRFSVEVTNSLSPVANQTRSKFISAADVWNIQRQKRSRIQRRFAL